MGLISFADHIQVGLIRFRADSSFVPSQWETSLQSNAISNWLGANLKSALRFMFTWVLLGYEKLILFYSLTMVNSWQLSMTYQSEISMGLLVGFKFGETDCIYLLWSGYVVWHHRNWLTLDQAMACCLSAPTPYLNHYWFIINEVCW